MKHQTQTAASRPGKQRSAPREPAQQQAGQQAAADAAILRRCRDDAGYFGSREGRWPPFLTDLVDRVRRSWDSSGRTHDTGDAADPLLRLVDPDILDLLLRIRWQYEPELAAATHPAVREIADVLLTDLAGSQGKGIRPGLQTHLLQEKLAPVFHRLAEQGEQSGSTSLDKAERKDKVESPFEIQLKHRPDEDLHLREPADAAEVREQIETLAALTDSLRAELRGLLDAVSPQADAAELHRSLAAIRAKYKQLLFPGETEDREYQEEELPREIIEALRAWPAGRRIVEGVDGKHRQENAEQFIARIFTEHFGSAIDSENQPQLYLPDLKAVNFNLYSALMTKKSRAGGFAESVRPYLLTKEDSLDQEIDTAFPDDTDKQLRYRKAHRLAAALLRRM